MVGSKDANFESSLFAEYLGRALSNPSVVHGFVANLLLPRTAYIGSIVKKLLTINPDLGAPDLIRIIKECTQSQTCSTDGFAKADTVDETKAIRLAKESCLNSSP